MHEMFLYLLTLSYGYMVELIDIFLRRKTTDKLVLEKPGIGKAVVNWVIVSILLFLVSLFWVAVFNFLMALISGTGNPVEQILLFALQSFIGMILVIPAVFIYVVLAYLTAKILGGKDAGIVKYFSIYLLVSASVLLVMAIIYPLFLIPIISIIPASLLAIYALYLQANAAASYFSFSTIRGALTVIVPLLVILAVILGIVLLLLFIMAITSVSTYGITDVPFPI